MSRAALRWAWVLAACLAACLAAAAPATAQDYAPEDPPAVEQPEEDGWDGEWWDDEGEEDWPEEEPAPYEPEPTVPALPPVVTPPPPPPPPRPPLPTIPVPATRTIKGKIAYVRVDGKAAIPRQAPKAVKRVIAAANEIVGKPYKWSGGHARLIDKGYDCSGTVGYALIRAGLLTTTMTSGQFARWGSKHQGRHITIYANKGHVYMEVAGLRLDTSAVGDSTRQKGPRWRPVIGRRAGFHTRHPPGL